ncbi:MAG TPA: hypothetical protein VF230_09630 [Acidimicrobiales bacterium]
MGRLNVDVHALAVDVIVEIHLASDVRAAVESELLAWYGHWVDHPSGSTVHSMEDIAWTPEGPGHVAAFHVDLGRAPRTAIDELIHAVRTSVEDAPGSHSLSIAAMGTAGSERFVMLDHADGWWIVIDNQGEPLPVPDDAQAAAAMAAAEDWLAALDGRRSRWRWNPVDPAHAAFIGTEFRPDR